MVARGEVWWYDHPNHKARPFLILTRSGAAAVLHQVTAVPTTTVVRSIPTEVALDAVDGMPRPCVLALDALTSIRTALCTTYITTLGPERMHEVCTALAISVDC